MSEIHLYAYTEAHPTWITSKWILQRYHSVLVRALLTVHQQWQRPLLFIFIQMKLVKTITLLEKLVHFDLRTGHTESETHEFHSTIHIWNTYNTTKRQSIYSCYGDSQSTVVMVTVNIQTTLNYLKQSAFSTKLLLYYKTGILCIQCFKIHFCLLT